MKTVIMNDINPNYSINSKGEVVSLRNGKKLKHIFQNNAYTVDIRNVNYPFVTENKRKKWMINKLVYHYFVSKIRLNDHEMIVMHRDNDKKNYSKNNLRLLKRNDFLALEIKKEIIPRPISLSGVILTKKDKKYIYDSLLKGTLYSKLIEKFKVSHATIRRAADEYNPNLKIRRTIATNEKQIKKIFKLNGLGFNNVEIANKIGITPSTVGRILKRNKYHL